MRRFMVLILFITSIGTSYVTAVDLFNQTFQLPRVFFGTENVSVRLTADNASVVTTTASNGQTKIWTREPVSLTFYKTEEIGDYAHGISYFINGQNQVDILYSFYAKPSYSFTLPANSSLTFHVYRITVVVYTVMTPDYTYQSGIDTSGPDVKLSPTPGAYGNTSVTASVTDSGCGKAADFTTSYKVFASGTSTVLSSGAGITLSLSAEGVYDVQFTAQDLLGNASTVKATYTVDYGPPTLSGITTSASTRTDGLMDFSLSFVLTDPGAGVQQSTVAVELQQQGGSTKSFAAASLTMAPVGVTVKVSIPTTALPRSGLFKLKVVASDKLGKTLTYQDTTNTIAMPPAPIVGTVQTSGISAVASDVGADVARLPIYTVPVVFDRPKAAFLSQGVSTYVLWRKVGSATQAEKVIEATPAVFLNSLVDQGGIAVLSDVMKGKVYAHQSITYVMDMKYSANGAESSNVAGVAALPNIEDWMARIRTDATVLLTYRSGSAPYSMLRIKSYDGVRFEIDPDAEGDALAARIEYRLPDGTTVTAPQDSWVASAPLSILFNGQPDAAYACRFVIQEASNPDIQYSDWFVINVNANSGQISADQLWDSDTTLSGSLDILPDATLTIGAGVHVTVANVVELTTTGDPLPGGSPSIIVHTGARLLMQTGSVIAPRGWTEGVAQGQAWKYWGGIQTQGQIDITSATIAGAVRGIAALTGSAVTVTGSRISFCRTGVQALGSSPVLSGDVFLGNERYAIKEDGGGAPVVTGNTFWKNTYDYYDSDLTVLDVTGMNRLSGNSGNVSATVAP